MAKIKCDESHPQGSNALLKLKLPQLDMTRIIFNLGIHVHVCCFETGSWLVAQAVPELIPPVAASQVVITSVSDNTPARLF